MHSHARRPQFGLFHGDPHPGNVFALRDGRIAYVDFGNVAEVSQANKQTLIDAVVHAVNEDYEEMAKDFIKLVRAAHAVPPDQAARSEQGETSGQGWQWRAVQLLRGILCV